MARESQRDQLKRCRDRVKFSQEWRKQEGYDSLWERLRKLYRMKHLPEGMGEEDRISVAIAFATVNAIAPSVAVNAPHINVNARAEEHQDQAVIIETVINYWFRFLDVKDELRLSVKDSIIFGHGWAKTTWAYAEVEEDLSEDDYQASYNEAVQQADQQAAAAPETAGELPTNEEIGEQLPKMQTRVLEDRPKVERVSPFDIFVDPEGTSIRNIGWICQRMVLPLDEVRKDPRFEQSAVRQLKGSYAIKDKYCDEETRKRDSDDIKRVCLYEFYDIRKNTFYVFADEGDAFLIKPQPIPFPFGHPFELLTNYEVPDCFYPIGDLEAVSPLQHELDKTRSQMMNHRKRYARKFIANPDALDQASINALASDRDGEVVFLKQGADLNDAIKPLPQEPMAPDAYQYSEIIQDDIDRVTGVNEYMRGQLPEIRRTATEASIIQDAANSRAADKLQRVEDFYAKVASRLIQMAQAMMTTEQVVRVHGKDGEPYWVKFDAEDISGEHDFEVEAGSTQPHNENFKRQQVSNFLQQMGPFIGQVLNPIEVARWAMQTAFGIKNPERFFVQQAPPPVPAAPGLAGPEGPEGAPPLGGAPAAPTSPIEGIPPEIIAQLIKQVGLPTGAPVGAPPQ